MLVCLLAIRHAFCLVSLSEEGSEIPPSKLNCLFSFCWLYLCLSFLWVPLLVGLERETSGKPAHFVGPALEDSTGPTWKRHPHAGFHFSLPQVELNQIIFSDREIDPWVSSTS